MSNPDSRLGCGLMRDRANPAPLGWEGTVALPAGSVLWERGPGGGSGNGNSLENTTRGIFPSEKGDVQSGQIMWKVSTEAEM